MSSLQINIISARERLDYLLSVGVKHRDVAKMILKQPQVLEYTIDNILKSHVVFLLDTACFILKLDRELGTSKECIVKMVKKHPQLLHYSTEDGILQRINFLRSIGM